MRNPDLAVVAPLLLASVCVAISGVEADYPNAVLADRPVAYWRFEGTGAEAAVADASTGKKHTGACHDVVLGEPSFVPSLGRSARFCGTPVRPSYVELGSPQALLLRGDVTVEWWQLAERVDAAHVILSWTAPGESPETNCQYEAAIRRPPGAKPDTPGHLNWVHESGAGRNTSNFSKQAAPFGTWCHVAVVRRAKERTIQFFLNGEPDGPPQPYQGVDGNPTGGDSGRLAIGLLPGFGTGQFFGRLDELAVYDRALPPERIRTHFRTALAERNEVQKVQIVGHRGARQAAPENTLAAIRRGLADGAPMVEIDLRMTRDGALVLMHDEAVDRTTGGKGRVGELTLAEVRKLDAGSRKSPDFAGEPVPTFEEAARLMKGKAVMMLDLKQPGMARAIDKVLEKTGVDRDAVLAGCWDDEQAADVRAHLPGVKMILIGKAPPAPDDAWFDSMQARGYRGLSLEWQSLTQRTIDAAHRRGLPVYTWTLNEPADLLGALAAGVDGIITDDPGALAALKRSLGAR